MRKAKPQKRVILPDPVYGEVMVAKFVNHLMLDGKKNTAYGVFYSALGVVDAKMKSEEKNALDIWNEEHDSVCPQARWSLDGREAGSRDHGCV